MEYEERLKAYYKEISKEQNIVDVVDWKAHQGLENIEDIKNTLLENGFGFPIYSKVSDLNEGFKKVVTKDGIMAMNYYDKETDTNEIVLLKVAPFYNSLKVAPFYNSEETLRRYLEGIKKFKQFEDETNSSLYCEIKTHLYCDNKTEKFDKPLLDISISQDRSTTTKFNLKFTLHPKSSIDRIKANPQGEFYFDVESKIIKNIDHFEKLCESYVGPNDDDYHFNPAYNI